MIIVVDYGAGNIGSVLNMIKKAGGRAAASRRPEDMSAAEKILLPGVGSFDNAVTKLESLGLMSTVRECAVAGVPLLGICLGMQLLADSSEEGSMAGLGLVPGRVRRFAFEPAWDLKIPHMGWNRVRSCKSHALTTGLDRDTRFYFVHSYHYECADPADRLLETDYGYAFTSAVQRGNVMGVQFHPEKSHRFGMQLLKNFIAI